MASNPMQTLDFEVYNGPPYLAMPNLIADRRIPASAAQVMRGRLEGELLFDRYHTTGDAIVYHPDGSVMLVGDLEDVCKLDCESTLHGGALVLPDSAWDTLDSSIDSITLSPARVAKYSCYWQSKEEVLESPFWRRLAGDDKDLLRAYADEMFGRVKSRYDLDEAMGVFVGGGPECDAPVLHLWCLGGIGSFGGRGDAYAYHRLDRDGGNYLVGISKRFKAAR